MNDAKLGAVIDLSVITNDGRVVNYGKHHNVLGSLVNNELVTRIKLPTVTIFRTYDNTDNLGYGTNTLSGTYYVNNKILYGLSGVSFSIIDNGSLFEFPSGFKAYKSSTINFSSCNIGVSGFESPSIVKLHKTNSTGYGASMGSNTLTKQTITSPSNNILTYTPSITSAIQSTILSATFLPTYIPYDLYRITYNKSIDNYGGYIDIIPPISLDWGDMLKITSFKYSLAFNIDAPRIFTISPITGLSGSGRIQRTIPYDRDEANFDSGNTGNMNRIYLLTDSNKISFLSSMRTSLYTTTITPKYTIIATEIKSAANFNATTRLSAWGSFTSDGTAIKQIVYGNTAIPTVISGIIEYDTPIEIPAGVRNLNLTSFLRMDVETP